MKRIVTIAVCVFLCSAVLSAHPGSALVTDLNDNAYFAYWGGTWKLNSTGRAERIHPNDFHFLALDVAGRFANVRLPEAINITPNVKPTLFAMPEYPGVFHTDGYLYQIPWSPGRLMLERVAPDGRKSNFVNTAIDPRIARKPGRHEGGLLAIASGPNNLLYVSDGASIWKISSQGSVSTVAENITVSDCPADLPVELPKPHIRSLSVDAAGNIYAAAIGCRAVLRISPSGQSTVVLRAEYPWSPCAVAVGKDGVYVMEYDNALAEHPADGRPRIRKLSSSGKVMTLHVAEKAEK